MKHRTGYILFFLLAVLVLAVPVAGAGQTITINTNISGSVFGNGIASDGAGPPNPTQSNAEDYHVIVNNGGTMSEDVYGGYVNSAS